MLINKYDDFLKLFITNNDKNILVLIYLHYLNKMYYLDNNNQ